MKQEVVKRRILRSYAIWYHPVLDKWYRTSWRGNRKHQKTKEIPNA